MTSAAIAGLTQAAVCVAAPAQDAPPPVQAELESITVERPTIELPLYDSTLRLAGRFHYDNNFLRRRV